MRTPLSLIDFCTRYPGESVGEATQRSVAFAQQAETPEFAGRVIDGLYRDPDLGDISGRTVIAAEVAARYDITDNGRTPPSHRDMLGAPRVPSSVIVR